MQPSGQYIQHRRHLVHFSLLIVGRKVRQKPVLPMLPTLGRERGVTSNLVDFFTTESHHHEEIIEVTKQREKCFVKTKAIIIWSSGLTDVCFSTIKMVNICILIILPHAHSEVKQTGSKSF